MDGSGPAAGGRAVLLLLLCLSLGAFVLTRALRASEDIVNTVVVTPTLERGEQASVRFDLTRPDSRAEVLIVTGLGGETVQALAQGADLGAGTHRFTWEGRDESGVPAPPGIYRIRVILGEQGRDIEPPGTIEVRGQGQ